MGAAMPIHEVAATDVFAARALSVLLARMSSSTQELRGLRAVFERGALDPALLADHDGPLARACARIESQGWLFGLVARELGSDVLFERRERQGLGTALQLVREMLAAEGRTLRDCELPEIKSSDARSTDVCAVVARCVYAGHAFEALSPWSFSRAALAPCLRFEAPVCAALQAELIAGAARLQGSRLRAQEQAWELWLPGDCVVWA
jgi:hypothetical protein